MNVWVHVLVLILSTNLFSSSSLSLLSTTESFFQETKTKTNKKKLVIDKNPMNSIQKIQIESIFNTTTINMKFLPRVQFRFDPIILIDTHVFDHFYWIFFFKCANCIYMFFSFSVVVADNDDDILILFSYLYPPPPTTKLVAVHEYFQVFLFTYIFFIVICFISPKNFCFFQERKENNIHTHTRCYKKKDRSIFLQKEMQQQQQQPKKSS